MKTMKFLEQMSIFDVAPSIKEIGKKPFIYSKIDWVTVIYKNVGLLDLINHFYGDCGVDFSEIIFNHENYIRSELGHEKNYRITLYGSVIFIPLDEVTFQVRAALNDNGEVVDPSVLLNHTFSRLRFDVSGSGLDYIRQQNSNFDSEVKLRSFFDIGEATYHFTRCDFAFDVINLCGDFIDQCLQYVINSNRFVTGYIDVMNTMSKRKRFSFKLGQESTLYIGSTKSPQLLRIYDKAKEFSHKYGNMVQSPYTYVDDYGEVISPDSWLRFELQLRRNEIIESFLFENSSAESIFKYIFDNFAFRVEKGMALKCWDDIFQYAELSAIIQNTNCVDVVLPFDRAEKFIEGNCISSLLVYLSYVGFDKFKERINMILRNMQQSDDYVTLLRWARIYDKIMLGSSTLSPDYLRQSPDKLFYIV